VFDPKTPHTGQPNGSSAGFRFSLEARFYRASATGATIWLTAAGPAVAADLARHLDPAVYPLSAVIADGRRLAAAFGFEEDRR
jgi:hypothetical protein